MLRMTLAVNLSGFKSCTKTIPHRRPLVSPQLEESPFVGPVQFNLFGDLSWLQMMICLSSRCPGISIGIGKRISSRPLVDLL